MRPRVDAASAVFAYVAHAVSGPRRRQRRLVWGTVGDEATRALPGDELIASPRWQYTHAIGIDAPSRAVVLMEPAIFVMQKKMLETIKQVAQRQAVDHDRALLAS